VSSAFGWAEAFSRLNIRSNPTVDRLKGAKSCRFIGILISTSSLSNMGHEARRTPPTPVTEPGKPAFGADELVCANLLSILGRSEDALLFWQSVTCSRSNICPGRLKLPRSERNFACSATPTNMAILGSPTDDPSSDEGRRALARRSRLSETASNESEAVREAVWDPAVGDEIVFGVGRLRRPGLRTTYPAAPRRRAQLNSRARREAGATTVQRVAWTPASKSGLLTIGGNHDGRDAQLSRATGARSAGSAQGLRRDGEAGV
jgi:hypothetical protein